MTTRLAELLGVSGSAPLLLEALTHPSYANEVRDARHYQRLEFLGDAVLGLCVSELLFERFPEADEGVLSRMRASLVNAEALSVWARENHLGEALRIGGGTDTRNLRDNTNVLSDMVEALIAVSYLEGGTAGARHACTVILGSALQALEADAARDPKSELQERVQRGGGPTPQYEVRESGGPPHDPWFEVVVRVAGTVIGSGRGRSKRHAERAAATIALQGLHDEPEPDPEQRSES